MSKKQWQVISYISIFFVLFSLGYYVVFRNSSWRVGAAFVIPHKYADGKESLTFLVAVKSKAQIAEATVKNSKGNIVCNLYFDEAYNLFVGPRAQILSATMSLEDQSESFDLEILYRDGTKSQRKISMLPYHEKLSYPEKFSQKNRLIEWEKIQGMRFYVAILRDSQGKIIYSSRPLYEPRFLTPLDLKPFSLEVVSYGGFYGYNSTSRAFIYKNFDHPKQAYSHCAYMVIFNKLYFFIEVTATDWLEDVKVNCPSLRIGSTSLKWNEDTQSFFDLIPLEREFFKYATHNVYIEWENNLGTGKISKKLTVAYELGKTNRRLTYDGKDTIGDMDWSAKGPGYIGLAVYLPTDSVNQLYSNRFAFFKAQEDSIFDLSEHNLFPKKPYMALSYWQDKVGDDFNVRVYSNPFYFMYRPKD